MSKVATPVAKRSPMLAATSSPKSRASSGTTLGRRVTNTTAISAGSHQDNLLVSLIEAINPSEATIQRRVDDGAQSYAKLLREKCRLDDKLAAQKKELQMAEDNRDKQQAIACTKQIRATELLIKKLQPALLQLSDLSSVVSTAKLQEETAMAIALYGSAIKHYNDKVDEAEIEDKLDEIEDHAEDLDNKGDTMGKPVTETLRDVVSMEEDIEADIDRKFAELDDLDTFNRLPAPSSHVPSAVRLTDSGKHKKHKQQKHSGSGGGELLLSEREPMNAAVARRPPRDPTPPPSPPPSSFEMSFPSVLPATVSTNGKPPPPSPAIEIPSKKKQKKKKHGKHHGSDDRKSSKRTRLQQLSLNDDDDPSSAARSQDDDICDALLDDELGDDIVFR
jgi:hypothetical protein